MNQTSVRYTPVNKEEQVAFLRAQMSKFVSSTPVPVAKAEDIVEIPGPLSKVLPGGGLARRQLTEVNDCPALAVEIIAQVSAQGGFVAVVGWLELSLTCLLESGDSARVVTIPDPGPEPWQITSALLEGMDLVIHHGAAERLSLTRARPIMAKLRAGKAALLSVGPHLPGSTVTVRGEVTTYRGIGRGTGRIRSLDIEVRSKTKTGQETTGLVTVGQMRRLELV